MTLHLPEELVRSEGITPLVLIVHILQPFSRVLYTTRVRPDVGLEVHHCFQFAHVAVLPSAVGCDDVLSGE